MKVISFISPSLTKHLKSNSWSTKCLLPVGQDSAWGLRCETFGHIEDFNTGVAKVDAVEVNLSI